MAVTMQIEFEDPTEAAELYRHCVDNDVGVEAPTLLGERQRYVVPLTDVQQETLITAYEEGYFDVPRETNLVELAGRFDISDTAVSQRLRRATKVLTEETLVHAP